MQLQTMLCYSYFYDIIFIIICKNQTWITYSLRVSPQSPTPDKNFWVCVPEQNLSLWLKGIYLIADNVYIVSYLIKKFNAKTKTKTIIL